MYEKIAAKLNAGEKLTQAEHVFLNVTNDYPPVRGLLSVTYLGVRAQRSVDWYFEVKKSGGKIRVLIAFETYHPRVEEILARLQAAVREIHFSSTSAKALRMRLTTGREDTCTT